MQPAVRNASALEAAFPPALSRCMKHRHASPLEVTLSNWRIIMNSPIPIKMLNHVLVLISAAILLHANNGLAADLVGDAQMQARDLLSGTVNGQAKTFDASPAIPADGHRTPNLDPQEQARQLILGKPNFGGVAGLKVARDSKTKVMPAVSARGKRRGYSDPQKSAQRMILGIKA
jgi:hypothetical protein